MPNLTSPLAGKIMQFYVKVGDTVAEDDEFMLMEAMKMENPVYASAAGVVKEIKVKEGQLVEEGDVVIVLE
jgi:acetyl-CoA carboxylase biotin carboxyl carrier protein